VLFLTGWHPRETKHLTTAGLEKSRFLKEIFEVFLFFGFLRFLKFFLNFTFCKAFLGVACLRCRQYVRNPAAVLATHTLIKLLILSN